MNIILQISDVERKVGKVCDDPFQLQRRLRPREKDVDFYEAGPSAGREPRSLALKVYQRRAEYKLQSTRK
jgi:hypothetical protein